MSARLPNPNRAKINRPYTVAEIARLFTVHRNTVRQWIKAGLAICDDKCPLLIRGRDLREFLHAKRKKNKCPCGPGEIYCVGCRAAKLPAGNMADYRPVSPTLGVIQGICPTCESMIYRRVNLLKLNLIRGSLDILLTQEHSRITPSQTPFVNS